MMPDAVRALALERHLAFVDEVSMAVSFERLSAWVEDVVLEGQRRLADCIAAQRPEADQRRSVVCDGLFGASAAESIGRL
jgi:hypothetical protein